MLLEKTAHGRREEHLILVKKLVAGVFQEQIIILALAIRQINHAHGVIHVIMLGEEALIAGALLTNQHAQTQQGVHGGSAKREGAGVMQISHLVLILEISKEVIALGFLQEAIARKAIAGILRRIQIKQLVKVHLE